MNFGQEEGRNGAATSGQYHVLLPDGRTQTVTYNVGDAYTGYVADVKYSGNFFMQSDTFNQGRNQDLHLAKQKCEILTGHKNRC